MVNQAEQEIITATDIEQIPRYLGIATTIINDELSGGTADLDPVLSRFTECFDLQIVYSMEMLTDEQIQALLEFKKTLSL